MRRFVGLVVLALLGVVVCGGGVDADVGPMHAGATSTSPGGGGATTAGLPTPDAETVSLPPGEGTVIGPAGAEVTSDDGFLTLTFPTGAVTEDVAVLVQSLPPAEWPSTLDDLDPAAVVYQLAPSGLTFREPVTFALTMDLEIGADGFVTAPMAVVVDAQGNGEPAGVEAELDANAGTAVVTGSLTHFSAIVGHSGPLAVSLEEVSPRKRPVKEPWEASVKVRNVNTTTPRLGIVVDNVGFASLDSVEVVGSTFHPGFALEAGETRELDFPVPRWECTDLGKGSYGVVARAKIDGSLVSAVLAKELAVANGLTDLLGLEGWDPYFTAIAKVNVTCVLPAYDVTTQDGKISITGRIADITKHFPLSGTFPGGKATLYFHPDPYPAFDPRTDRISSCGDYNYQGRGSGASIIGKGDYCIEGKLGEPLTLRYSGQGRATPGKKEKTKATLLLTPVK